MDDWVYRRYCLHRQNISAHSNGATEKSVTTVRVLARKCLVVIRQRQNRVIRCYDTFTDVAVDSPWPPEETQC